MTMLIGFAKDFKSVEYGEFTEGQTAYLPRKLAQTLIYQNIAVTYAEFLKPEVVKETEVLKVKKEKAVIEPVVVETVLPGKCKGKTASGEDCKAAAQPESEYCWRHKPKEGSS